MSVGFPLQISIPRNKDPQNKLSRNCDLRKDNILLKKGQGSD